VKEEKFLNFEKVLCISPHPDDVEIAMMGTIMKYSGTAFDILCLTKGGAMGYDDTNSADRRGEVRDVWQHAARDNVRLYDSKYEYFEDTSEPGWINHIEKDFVHGANYDCIFMPTGEDSMFEHRYANKFGAAICRASLISLVEYHVISTLNTWQPNLFVNVEREYVLKLKALKKFASQQEKSYFKKPTLDSFHSNFQCSKKGLKVVEKFKVIEMFGGVK
jgi:LmbE family N-acetylglucosaminyl deacetylase